jgi:predicted phage baseplate assembly protein
MTPATSLPVPHLDDRRFQDLVDDAKRLVQQRCPEWTDHNVSDPGVTLIEAFAGIVDQLLYRLNRVPQAHYVRFLDLIGVRLQPPTAAAADVTFWLSAPRPDPVVVPAEAPVAAPRGDGADPIVFTTREELTITPCALSRVLTGGRDGDPVDRTDDLRFGHGFAAFATPPAPGDALYVGLTAAVPRCAVLLRWDCVTRGVGVDPRDPPLAWEAWDGSGWVDCTVDRDETGGFNKRGDVVLHVPAGHVMSTIGRVHAGWLRCRTTVPAPGRTFYSDPPRVQNLTAATIGATVAAEHAETVHDELIGLSAGVPGQRFAVAHRPLVASAEPLELEVGTGPRWLEVEHFAGCDATDRVFVVDHVAGEIVFGPAVREPDGSLRHYGAVPPKAAALRLPRYRTGGGRRGNVARDTLTVQRDPVPFVTEVQNRRPATGGVDRETVENAALRGPLTLRTRDRAVTAEDYELLARECAPEVARVRCVSAGADASRGGVRVLVVPAAADDGAGRIRFEDLLPTDETLARIREHLDRRRCLGARVVVEPPYYQGVTVLAALHARRNVAAEILRLRATEALYRYLNPVGDGPSGAGWPFGRPVQAGEMFAVLQRVDGVEMVGDVRLYGADPLTGTRGERVDRLDLAPHALVFSYAHQIRIIEG